MAASMPRTFQVARRASGAALAASRSGQNVAGGITLPMAIWSRRQFSSGQGLSLPPPLSSFGASSGGGQPSYFQRTQRLPTNTIVNFVPQQQAWVVERFGRFSRILDPGLTVLIPAVDRIAYVQSLKESALEIPSQSAITSDNVTLELDGVLYTRVFDAYRASYGVEDAEYAISQLAQTTMRSEIGQLTLDNVLKERANLNAAITQAINEAAEVWGIKCLRYEIRDVKAPDEVVKAMHRQVTAERSKRAEILESEGQRQSAINIAEGRKQSVILASEAVQAEQINTAAGDAEAIKLRAMATAQGIDAVAESLSRDGANAQNAINLRVAEKYVEAFGNLAKEGTAVVVPGNVGDMGGMIAQAMAVYGRIAETQNQAKNRPSNSSSREGTRSSRPSEIGQQIMEAAQSAETPNVADTMLEGFENTARR